MYQVGRDVWCRQTARQRKDAALFLRSYIHISRTYTPLYDPLHPGRLVGYQPSPGMTYNVGRNKAKRERRALGKQWRAHV